MKELREKFTCTLIILLNVSGLGYVFFGKFNPPVSQPVQQLQQESSLSRQTHTQKQICTDEPAKYKKGFEEEWPKYVRDSRHHHEAAAIKALQQYGEYRARWQDFIRQCKKEVSGWQPPFSQGIVEKAIREDCEGRINNYLSLLPMSESQLQHPRELIAECTNQITAGWHIPEKIRQAVSR